MIVLVDTSVWINYFKFGEQSSKLDTLIDENMIVINDLILTEIIPFLQVKKQLRVIHLLQGLTRYPMQIDWEEIIELQVKCIKSGFNGIGIPDLLIAQNSKNNNCIIYTFDKHFKMLQKIVPIELF